MSIATQVNKVAEISETANLARYEKKVRHLKNFNHIIVHNLRGIAANIKMLVEVLMKVHVYKDEASEKMLRAFSLQQGLSFIGDSSASLINILSDLTKGMDLNTANELEYEKCDIAEIVSNISCQLNGFIHENGSRINLVLGVTHIEYPKCYMESLLYNLISNALKYTRPGVPAQIEISSHRRNGRVVLSVKDNGLGIDLQKHGDRIFDLGQIFHKGYDSKGIGLYITKQQVESLGGKICVRSEVNVGSEFIVTF